MRQKHLTICELVRSLWRGVVYSAILALISTSSLAQLSQGGRPVSFTIEGGYGDLETETLANVNIDSLLIVNEVESAEGKPFRICFAIETDFTLENSGEWTSLADGSRLWRLRIESPGAKTLSINYDVFLLIEGAELFVFNPVDTTEYLGAFTYKNNKQTMRMATGMIRGDEVVLELYEPYADASRSILNISSIVHGYQISSDNERGYGDAAYCNIDVNCDEGDSFWDQIRSVVMFTHSNNTRICSGSLLNNVSEDATRTQHLIS